MNINKYGINNMYLKQTFLIIALGAMAMTAAAQLVLIHSASISRDMDVMIW